DAWWTVTTRQSTGAGGSDLGELAEPFAGRRVGEHAGERLLAFPLGVVDDLGAVEASVDVGGDEAREVADDLIGGALPGLDQAALVSGLDGEHVDEGHHGLSARIVDSPIAPFRCVLPGLMRLPRWSLGWVAGCRR